MKRLSVEQIIKLQEQLIAVTGGTSGVKDKGLIEASVFNVFDSYFDVEKYPTIEEKAARLCYSLVKNHAFVDGNKRIGILAMLVFLEINNIVLHCTNQELVDLGVGLASGRLHYGDVLNFIEKHV